MGHPRDAGWFIDLSHQPLNTRINKHSANCANADCYPDTYFFSPVVLEKADPRKRQNYKTHSEVKRRIAIPTMRCLRNWPPICHYLHPRICGDVQISTDSWWRCANTWRISTKILDREASTWLSGVRDKVRRLDGSRLGINALEQPR